MRNIWRSTSLLGTATAVFVLLGIVVGLFFVTSNTPAPTPAVKTTSAQVAVAQAAQVGALMSNILSGLQARESGAPAVQSALDKMLLICADAFQGYEVGSRGAIAWLGLTTAAQSTYEFTKAPHSANHRTIYNALQMKVLALP